jgi:CRP/FNR family transcriptional activator FtrB
VALNGETKLPFQSHCPEGSRCEAAELAHICEFPLFSGVDESLVDDLLARCVRADIPAGGLIIQQDQQVTSFTIISHGLVDLTRVEEQREFGVLLLSARDVLLPAAALFAEPSLVSARALTDTSVCSISVDLIKSALASSPQLSTNLLAVTSGQWRMSVRNVLDVSCRSASQRAGAFLLRLVDLQANCDAPTLPFSKRDLAARLGITAETLSRVLQTLAEEGLHLRGRAIIVRDRRSVEEFCGPDPYLIRHERRLGVFAI